MIDALDDRLYRPRDIEDILSRPNLVTVPRIRRRLGRGASSFEYVLRLPVFALCESHAEFVPGMANDRAAERREDCDVLFAVYRRGKDHHRSRNGCRGDNEQSSHGSGRFRPSPKGAGALLGLTVPRLVPKLADPLDICVASTASPAYPRLDVVFANFTADEIAEPLCSYLRKMYDLVIIDAPSLDTEEGPVWLAAHVEFSRGYSCSRAHCRAEADERAEPSPGQSALHTWRRSEPVCGITQSREGTVGRPAWGRAVEKVCSQSNGLKGYQMMSTEYLEQLEAESIHIFREVAATCARPVLLYSIGKNSSVLLHLAMKAFHPARIPFPLLHIDTTWKFKEMIAFRDRTVSRLGLDLIVHRNESGVADGINPFDYSPSAYTHVMKTVPLREALDKHGFDAAFGGARRDEEIHARRSGFFPSEMPHTPGTQRGSARRCGGHTIRASTRMNPCVSFHCPIGRSLMYGSTS